MPDGLGWHVISGEDMLAMLRRCASGEAPDMVYAEEYANAERERVEAKAEPDELWHAIAVGYCEWTNGDWPDDDDLVEARAAARHIEGYVKRWVIEYAAEDVWLTIHEEMPDGVSSRLVRRALRVAVDA